MISKVIVLSLLVVNSGTAFAAVYTVEPNKPYQQNFNITGRGTGPYNIRVTVESPLQNVIQQNNQQAFVDSPLNQIINSNNSQPISEDAKPKEPPKPPSEPNNSTLKNLFPNLFGDESHHHGADGSDVPSTGSSGGSNPYASNTPSTSQPYLPSLPPRLDDEDYVCYNYVWEQMTGKPSTEMLNPQHIIDLLKSFKKEEYKPGTKLPEKFPPGTVLFFAGHVGIVGADGQTIFNYTKKSDENNLPATLHQTPSANTLWQTRDPDAPAVNQADYVPNDSIWDRLTSPSVSVQGRKPGKQPYAGSPAQVYTPPGQ